MSRIDDVYPRTAEMEAELSGLFGITVHVKRDPSVGNNPNEWRYLGAYRIHNIESDCPAATFNLAELPGCCGICVLNHLMVYNAGYRHRGIGTCLTRWAQRCASDANFTSMIATDITKNYTKRIFAKTGWVKLYEFENVRTNNDVGVWRCGLK